MNDLLSTVKGSQGPGRGAQVFDIEAGFTAAQSERTKEMEEFFAAVDDVKRAIAAIKTKQRDISRMHEQSKTIVRKNDMQEHRAEVQVRLTAISTAVLRLHSLPCTPSAMCSRPCQKQCLARSNKYCAVCTLQCLQGATMCQQRLLQRAHAVLQGIINEVNTLAHQAKAKLEQVDKINTAAQQKKGQGVGSASERTRTSITSGGVQRQTPTGSAQCAVAGGIEQPCMSS